MGGETGGKWTGPLILALSLLAGLLAGVFWGLAHDLPEINRLKQFKPAAVTTVYSKDNRIIDRFFLQQRFPVHIGQVPDILIQALITTEDREFYRHSGIHLKGIFRALVLDILAGSFKQGASTLTQQLAKTLFLSPEKSIVRKIREAILAVQIERRYTKAEILEMYLNLIYLGSGTYGVEAASQAYFGRSVSDLTIGQAALIAGLPKAPSIYSPKKNPELARKRRKIVLDQMLALGVIEKSQYNLAMAEPVYTGTGKKFSSKAPYFTTFLKEALTRILETDTFYSKGLHIQTTLDLALQDRAEAAVQKHLSLLGKRVDRNEQETNTLQAALVAIDVTTGAIRVMIGGRDNTADGFNRAVQARRQPGSAFKPFVYAAALAKGWSQHHTLPDAPLSMTLPGSPVWQVHNFSHGFKGEMTLRKALALSKNTPVVRLMNRVGINAVTTTAKRLGIGTPLSPFPSLALGACDLSLMELTAAYIPFANRGIRVTPFAIDQIAGPDGRILFRSQIGKEAVMSRQDAAVMTDMLKAAIYEGTGRKAARLRKDIAGKTGTTNDYRDALFIGFSPELCLGVWVGRDNAAPLGPEETGARAALPIWIDTMEFSLADRPPAYFDLPNGTRKVTIHPDTGEILTSGRGSRDHQGKDKDGVRALLKSKDLE